MSKNIGLIFKKDEEPGGILQTQNTNMKSFKCPGCSHIIQLDEHQMQETVLQCPICGQHNMLKLASDQSKEKQALSNLSSLFSELDRNAVILGSILFVIGLILLILSKTVNFKINLTIAIIGMIISSFVIKNNKDTTLKITVGIILLVLFLYFITGAEIEMFLLLLFISVLIMKILLDEYLPTVLKMRMNVFLVAFFVIFLILVIKRIINVINI